MVKTLRWQFAQFLEKTWWRIYLQGKDVSRYLQWKKTYWEGVLDRLKSHVSLSEGMSVLDAGCGPAGVFIALDRCQVVAVDPLLNEYSTTLAHFKPEMYPQVAFESTPLETFKSEIQFDVVFCMNAINHVSQLDEAFLALYQHIKPGGKLVVSIDAHRHKWIKHFFRWQPGDMLHPHQYDLNEYQKMITDLGGSIEHVELLKKEFFFDYYVLVASKPE